MLRGTAPQGPQGDQGTGAARDLPKLLAVYLQDAARAFFSQWLQKAKESALRPITKVAVMLHDHLQGLLNYVTHRVTNAVTEGFNSKIQMIKSCARGFRSFENYRVAILFHCGKPQPHP